MPKRSIAACALALVLPAAAQAHDLARGERAALPDQNRMVAFSDHVPKRVARALGGDVTPLPTGLYEVETSKGFEYTTHGPDWRGEMRPDEAGDTAEDLSNGPERAPACVANPATDYYQQVLYAYPSAGTNNLAANQANLQAQIRRNNWLLNDQSLASGGPEADYEVLCDAGNAISITAFPVTAGGTSASFSQVVNSAIATGFTSPRVDYTIFYQGTSSSACGVGNVVGDERPIVGNLNNVGGDYGMSYMGCWFGRTSMHENSHNQGAVQYSAPNSTGTGWHCNELDDVMCYVDGGNLNQQMISCPVQPGIQHFDCAWNTYFDSVPEPGEWLDDHWNIGSTLNRFVTFGTDTRVPDTTITAGPSGLTNAPIFVFEASEEPATFDCSVQPAGGGPSFSSCISPKTYQALADGDYDFAVRGRDTAGNLDASPATRSFTLDRTAPDTRMDSAPTGTIETTSASFAFSVVGSEPNASLECKLDAGGFAPCGSPQLLSGLAEGPHTFQARALDSLGNRDPTPAVADFAVDSKPPVTAITSGPADVLRVKRRARVSFQFTSNEPGSGFECRLDSGGFEPCDSPESFRVRRGRHTFEVRAIDPNGNVDSSPAVDSFKVKRKHRRR